MIGVASEYAEIFGLVTYSLLIILLVVFLFDPWLPLIEREFTNPAETGDENSQSRWIESGYQTTDRIRAWEIRGWMVFCFSMLILMVIGGSFSHWLKSHWLKYNGQTIIPLCYFVLLLTLVLFSTLLLPAIGIFHAMRGQEHRIKDSLAISCLGRFQSQGWLLLFLMAIYLMLYAII